MATVLVIEDERDTREYLVWLLQRAGHDVVTAVDGVEGMAQYRACRAALVITDIIMPEKDGIETILELKRDYPGVKIIAISGGGMVGPASYLKSARLLGADEVISKPLSSEEVLLAVEKLTS